MMARWASLGAVLLVPGLISPALGAKKPLSIALDGFSEPGGDSARVTVVAQIDSIPGVTMGPLVVSYRVRDGNGRTLVEKERVEPVPKDNVFPRLITWGFRAGSGKLKVRFQAKGLDIDGDGRAEFEMNVPQFVKEPFPVSTPRVGTFPLDQAEDDAQLASEFRMLPSHRFVAGKHVVGILLSLRDTKVTDSLRVRVVLRRDDRVVKDSSYVAWRGRRNASENSLMGFQQVILRENTARWGGGQYKFQITLNAPTLKTPMGTVQRTGEFQVAAGGVDLLRDPVLVRTVLGYIATGEERLAFEMASADSLPALWKRFWDRRDPSPGTGTNEALERFLDRVERTGKLGGVVPGWRSDQGRILIQYGEPERTEEVMDPGGRIRTQIWYYDSRHTSYVFQDVDGFGNYQLVGGR